jgi:hypothetical protein
MKNDRTADVATQGPSPGSGGLGRFQSAAPDRKGRRGPSDTPVLLQAIVCLAGAAPGPPAPTRRASARHRCGRGGACRTLPACHDERWLATVRDISAGGVGLLLSRRFEPGVLLAVELPEGESARSVLARVAHATARGRGEWLVGCRFLSPLDEDELRLLRT